MRKFLPISRWDGSQDRKYLFQKPIEITAKGQGRRKDKG